MPIYHFICATRSDYLTRAPLIFPTRTAEHRACKSTGDPIKAIEPLVVRRGHPNENPGGKRLNQHPVTIKVLFWTCP
jgi:hypothetical protein